MAKKQGYAYTIRPEKVRTKTKKPRRRKHARRAAPAAAHTTPAPAYRAVSRGGISLDEIRAVKGLVERIGGDKLQELAGMLSK
jgi:hypothetical protein